MYALDRGTWRTPKGNSATFVYRQDTADWNTIQSSCAEDEYHLRDLSLTGWALDIGGYVGSVSVALAVDNPELQVICVEAVPPNVDLIHQNLELNGVADRVAVLQAPAGNGRRVTVRWGFRGGEVAQHHAFVGNALLVDQAESETLKAKSLTLAEIIGDRQIAFAKVDCEGCEFPLLQGPALAQIERIHGEFHDDPEPLENALAATHTLNLTYPIPGAFEAVRRA